MRNRIYEEGRRSMVGNKRWSNAGEPRGEKERGEDDIDRVGRQPHA